MFVSCLALNLLKILTEIAVIRHISLELNVNFEEKTLQGKATYDIDVLQNKGKVVSIFDRSCF